MCEACPGFENMITPPQAQFNVEILSNAGALQSITLGAPTAQGVRVIGTQGMGVRTPKAAAVAAATIGFDGD